MTAKPTRTEEVYNLGQVTLVVRKYRGSYQSVFFLKQGRDCIKIDHPIRLAETLKEAFEEEK